MELLGEEKIVKQKDSHRFDRTAHDNFLKKHGMGAGDLIITGSPVQTGFGWIGQSRKQQYVPIPKAKFSAKSSTTGKKHYPKDKGKIIPTGISKEFPAVAIIEWNNPASLRSSVAERELEIFKLWEFDVYNKNLPKVTRDRNGTMRELKDQDEHFAHPEDTEQYLRLMEKKRTEEEAAAMRKGEKMEGEGVKVARRYANPIGSPVRGDTQHSSLSPITLPSDFTSDDSDRKDSDDDPDVISLPGDEEENEEQTATNESDRSSTSSEDEQVHNAMIDALALEQQQQKQTPDQIRASAPTTRNPFVKFARWVKSWFN